MFLYYTRHGINFRNCEKYIFESFDNTKIRNDSKWTKTSRNEVMQPTTSNNESQPIFPMSTIWQVLTIAFLTQETLYTWAFRRWLSLFIYLKEFKVAYQWRQLERLIFDYTPIIAGTWKSRFKIFEFKCLCNQEGCSP